MTARVRMYTTSWCGYCVRARRLLVKKGIAFDEIDVSNDPATRRHVILETGHRTVPVILIDDQLIGGCDELHALDRAGRLEHLLGR